MIFNQIHDRLQVQIWPGVQRARGKDRAAKINVPKRVPEQGLGQEPDSDTDKET